MGGRAEHSWLNGGHLQRQNAQDGLAITKNAVDSKKFLVLFLWRFYKPGLCLNYLLQPPAWFEGNHNRLGAGAFEITPRMLPFERVAAAMPKTQRRQYAIFDMGLGFFMADARP
jgi:hypothetical protein